MAKIFPGALGTPVGKHGNTVFRRTNKKTFSYELNKVFNKSVSENVAKNRKNFGVLVKFCNFINKSETINKIWKRAKVKGYAPNRKILKYNDMLLIKHTKSVLVFRFSQHHCISTV